MAKQRPVSIPQDEVYSWASQVWQYPEYGMPGLCYFKGVLPQGKVNCLLWRDEHGLVIGILNHYPTDMTLEKAGNVNVFIHPRHKRRGIGTTLINECVMRWGPINMDQQRYTPEGAAFAKYLDERHSK